MDSTTFFNIVDRKRHGTLEAAGVLLSLILWILWIGKRHGTLEAAGVLLSLILWIGKIHGTLEVLEDFLWKLLEYYFL